MSGGGGERRYSCKKFLQEKVHFANRLYGEAVDGNGLKIKIRIDCRQLTLMALALAKAMFIIISIEKK
jgi:hypothetical protein